METRNCRKCNESFLQHQYNQKTCVSCLKKYDKRYDEKRLIKTCKGCGEDFKRSAPMQYYCTPKCKAANLLLLNTYGITRKDWEILYDKQEGVCAICDGEGFVMQKSKYHDYSLCVDHCHETGKIRGLLCHNCNRALGLFQDNTDTISKAIKYLEGATTIEKSSTPKQVEAQGKGKKGRRNMLIIKNP